MNLMDINKIKPNPDNPRVIKDEKFKKLVKSIQEFPEMLKLRPLVIDENNVVLGGNMRLMACKELGLKEVPTIQASELSEEQKREFIIKDNVGFGEWDWDKLANEWDENQLVDWGLDLPTLKELNENDLFDIEIPFYEPSKNKPEIIELANIEKTKELINKIDSLDIDNSLKEILKYRAAFFTDFNFQAIADFYYNENENVKEIFKSLGLVILAPKEALKKGFMKLSDDIWDL